MPTEPSSTLGGKTPLGYPRGVFLIASSRSSVEASRHGMDESDSDASLAGGEGVPLPCAQRAHVLSYPTRVRRQRLRGRQHIVPVSAPSKRSTCVQPPGHSRASSEQPVCARCPCGAVGGFDVQPRTRSSRSDRARACVSCCPTHCTLACRSLPGHCPLPFTPSCRTTMSPSPKRRALLWLDAHPPPSWLRRVFPPCVPRPTFHPLLAR